MELSKREVAGVLISLNEYYPWWLEEVRSFLLSGMWDDSVRYDSLVLNRTDTYSELVPTGVSPTERMVSIVKRALRPPLNLFEPTVIAAARSGHLGLIRALISCSDDVQRLLVGQQPWLFAAYVSARQERLQLVEACLEALANQLLQSGDSKPERKYCNMYYAYNVWKFITHHSITQSGLDGTGGFDYENCLLGFFDYRYLPRHTLMVHLAATHGDTEDVARLLSQDSSYLNATQELGFTPLHLAAINGHESTVIYLLNQVEVQLDLRDKIFGRIPLHYACENGHVSVVHALLTRYIGRQDDIDIDVVDFNGVTPLHLAASQGHAQIVRLLLTAKKKCDGNPKAKHSFLHYRNCSLYGNRMQIMYNDFMYGLDMFNSEVSLLAFPYSLSLPILGLEGFTALHFAIAHDQKSVVEAILEISSQSYTQLITAHDNYDLTIVEWAEAASISLPRPASDIAHDSPSISPNHLQGDPHDNNKSMSMSKISEARAFYLQIKRERGKLEYIQRMHSLIVAVARGEIVKAVALAHIIPSREEDDVHAEAHEETWGVQMQAWKMLKVELQVFKLTSPKVLDPNEDIGGPVLAYSRASIQDVLLALVKRKAFYNKSVLDELMHWATQGRMERLLRELVKEDYKCDLVNTNVKLLRGISMASFLSRMGSRMPDLIVDIESRGDVRRHMYEERQVYVDYANTLLVGAVLIAGLAFQVWLQPPRGFTDGAHMSSKPSGPMQAVVYSTVIGFFLAMATVLAGANGAMPLQSGQLAKAKANAHRSVVVGSILLAGSIACVATSFFSAAFAVLPSSLAIQGGCVFGLGSPVLLVILVWFLIRLERLAGGQLFARLAGIRLVKALVVSPFNTFLKMPIQVLFHVVLYLLVPVRESEFVETCSNKFGHLQEIVISSLDRIGERINNFDRELQYYL